MKTLNVMGLPVRHSEIKQLASDIQDWVSRRESHWVVTLNLDYISRMNRDGDFKQMLYGADVFTADGVPIVWACRKLDPEFREMTRTTGADLTPLLLRGIDPREIAIVGGVDPRRAILSLNLSPDEFFIYDGVVEMETAWAKDLAAKIGDRGLVLVALGCPKQEEMIALLKPHLPNTVFVAVGGSFELISGIIKRAPRWMQRGGLEWLFRLMNEPRRLWRRYILEYPAGALALIQFVSTAKRAAAKTLPPV